MSARYFEFRADSHSRTTLFAYCNARDDSFKISLEDVA